MFEVDSIWRGDAINENLELWIMADGIGTHLPLAMSILFRLSEYFCMS